MRGKELNEIQLINLLLKNKKLRLTSETQKMGVKGENSSFYDKMNIKPDGKGGYDDTQSPVSYKTLNRQVQELHREGIFTKDEEGFYRISNMFLDSIQLKTEEWSMILEKLLENGEQETYRRVRNCLGKVKLKFVLDDVDLNKYQNTVKEPIHFLSHDKEVVRNINEALEHSRKIRISYKGQERTIFPVCYVISRDGVGRYLYGIRKKEEPLLMNLEDIQVLEHLETVELDRECYLEQIRMAWNVELTKPYQVKLKVIRGLEDSLEVEKQLKRQFGAPVEVKGNYLVYRGDVIGIDDFKAWLRCYPDICIVMEPEGLREEIIASLRAREERYGGA